MRKLLIIFLILFSLGSFAQEGLTPLILDSDIDSVPLAQEQEMLLYAPLFGTSELNLLNQSFQLPEFDFKSALKNRWSYDLSGLSMNSNNFGRFYFSRSGFYTSPFLRDGAIFSSGQYQLSDKFKIGGYSYGANSVFSAPLPNQGLNNFDYRGATMYMQYKVSKNFKIETSVNVQQGR